MILQEYGSRSVFAAGAERDSPPGEGGGVGRWVGTGSTQRRLAGNSAFLLLVTAVLLLVQGAVAFPTGWPSDPVRLLIFASVSLLLVVTAVFPGTRSSVACCQALRSPGALAVLVFLGWVGLSVAQSRLPAVSAYEAVRYLAGGLLFLAIGFGIDVRDACQAARIATAALVATGTVSLLLYGHSLGKMAGGAFGEEQLLAAVLCVLLPISLSVLLRDPEFHWRVVGVLSVMSGMAALLLTANRTAWVALTLGIGVQLWLEARLRQRTGSRRLPLQAVTILLSALALFALVFGQGPQVAQRALSLSGTSEDATYRWRREMWSTAGRMLAEKPWWGWGVGTFGVHQAVFNADGRSPREILAQGVSLSESAHNSYLQVAAEMGYPGLALYLSAPLSLAYTLMRRLRNAHAGWRASSQAAALGGLLAFSISAYANPAWEFAQCAAFQWFVFGFAALVGRTDVRRSGAVSDVVRPQ